MDGLCVILGMDPFGEDEIEAERKERQSLGAIARDSTEDQDIAGSDDEGMYGSSAFSSDELGQDLSPDEFLEIIPVVPTMGEVARASAAENDIYQGVLEAEDFVDPQERISEGFLHDVNEFD